MPRPAYAAAASRHYAAPITLMPRYAMFYATLSPQFAFTCRALSCLILIIRRFAGASASISVDEAAAAYADVAATFRRYHMPVTLSPYAVAAIAAC